MTVDDDGADRPATMITRLFAPLSPTDNLLYVMRRLPSALSVVAVLFACMALLLDAHPVGVHSLTRDTARRSLARRDTESLAQVRAAQSSATRQRRTFSSRASWAP